MGKYFIGVWAVATSVCLSAGTAVVVTLFVLAIKQDCSSATESAQLSPIPSSITTVSHEESYLRSEQQQRAIQQHEVALRDRREAETIREALSAANAQQSQEASNHFLNIIRRRVEQEWLIPTGASDSMAVTVQVRLGPSGEVLFTAVANSSGDAAFDSSAIQAIHTAAPFGELRNLPGTQQRNFRHFYLRFSPGDVRD
nr:TonB family protein [uncultured Halomonas sp.]